MVEILVRAIGIALIFVSLMTQTVSAADNRIIVQSIGNSSGGGDLLVVETGSGGIRIE